MVVVLDSGPLSQAANPTASTENYEVNNWLRSLLAYGVQVIVPEIADYEVRRELLRRNNRRAIARLDELRVALDDLPITTRVMLKAAEYWALARQQGRVTAPDPALDGDVILAAQAHSVVSAGEEAVIATTNVRHLELFADARLWREISPQ